MSLEAVTTALQVNATTGSGETLVLREPRLVTFKITGNGPVLAGQITVECCPQATPIAPGSGSAGAIVWEALYFQTTRPSPHMRWVAQREPEQKLEAKIVRFPKS